ncbi:Hsp20/alpha crystallin family protein [bacterium]|nr:Hsp20/alpha crystallin family protein [bacterium]
MFNKKRSFFERLTGIVDDGTEVENPHSEQGDLSPRGYRDLPMKGGGERRVPEVPRGKDGGHWSASYPSHSPVPVESEEDAEGQLAVDVYQTRTEIILQTMVAGIRPDDLNITITHDKVTVSGRREGPHGIPPEDYFHGELYWGNFSRTVFLPQEIEPEEVEAIEKHGLLILRLPKVDKEREHKIKIKQL